MEVYLIDAPVCGLARLNINRHKYHNMKSSEKRDTIGCDVSLHELEIWL